MPPLIMYGGKCLKNNNGSASGSVRFRFVYLIFAPRVLKIRSRGRHKSG